jgi:hypothetical protein
MSNESRHQHDEEDGVDHKDDASIKVSNSQRAYQASNESKKQLFLMCLGLTEKGTPVFDLDAAPWRDIKKREIKPSRIALGEEIRRRMSSILPCNAADRVHHHHHKSANWDHTKCTEWLQQNPVQDQDDIIFLKREVQRQIYIQRHLSLLLHTITCHSPTCPSPNCAKMKGLLKHRHKCSIKAAGGCHVCRRMCSLL